MQPILFGFDMNSHLARVFKVQAKNDVSPSYPEAYHLGEPVFCLRPLLNLVETEIRIMRSKGLINTHVVLVFDSLSKNFRHDMFPDYKANRPPKPADWVRQESLAFDMFRALGYPCLRVDGVESDDVLKTISAKLSLHKIKSVLFTRDKDLMSCCDEHTSMFSGVDKRWIQASDAADKFGVPVSSILDYLAIVGDTADNVPGIHRAGPGAAKAMLNTASLSSLIAQPELILTADFKDRKYVSKWVRENPEKVVLSRQLVELKSDVELNMNFQQMVKTSPDYDVFLSGYMRPAMQ
jgi:DNA polymerase-1